MKYLICLLIASTAFNSSYSWGQSTGFYGKRKFIEFSGNGNWALLNKLTNSENFYSRTESGNNLVKDNHTFNYGLNGTIGTAPKSGKVGFSLTASLSFYKSSGPYYVYYNEANNSYAETIIMNQHEHLNLRTFSIMPTLLIFGGNMGSPSGIAHEIGIGYNQTKVVEKDYLYKTNGTFYDSNTGQYLSDQIILDSIYPNNSYIDFNKKAKGLTLMYAFKMRTPLSKSLLLTYGLKYALNFNLSKISSDNSSSSYYSSSQAQNWDNVLTSIKRTQIRSIISLNLGLAYVF